MNHTPFTADHDSLRQMIRSFVETEVLPHVEAWEESGFPDDLFLRMGDIGLLGLDKALEYGGQGGDFASNLVLAEELARANCAGLSMGISAHTGMAMPPLVAFGTEELKKEWVIPAIRGERILCLGITEAHTGSDVAAIRTTARRDGTDYVINGDKAFITNGMRADGTLLVTRTDSTTRHDGFTLFMVPLDQPGVTRSGPLKKAGMHASDTALLNFEDVRVPATALVGEEGQGFRHIMWQLQGERLIAAAHCVASANWCLDKTTTYASERHAFGKPIGDFQAIRHKIAQMIVDLEAARHLVYSAARRYQAGDYPVREIAIAKLHAARTACQVADTCLQIHGGAGYLAEYGIERAWRDLRIFRIAGGTDEIMLDIIARTSGLPV
jgi:alkylation response protein AidB-like acyl-CoA dehydrogenase